uniref:ST6-66 n=1 Tax=Eutrema halophilum TaxID=98038 RepID=B4YYA5_EUTHA|nr:ST6-66 [Eutrema halophilum]
MNFISDQEKKLSNPKTAEPEHIKPVEGTETTKKPASSAEVWAGAKIVPKAAQAAARNESDKLDKGKVAGASVDILNAAEKYGKLDEKSGVGQYLEKAEKFLNEYESTHSTSGAGAPPPAAASHDDPAAASHEEPAAKKAIEKSGGGLGGYAKMAQGFMKGFVIFICSFIHARNNKIK